MCIARHAAGAAWLSEALRTGGGEGGRGGGTAAAATTTIRKLYLALLDTRHALPLPPGASGVVDAPLPLTPVAGGAAKKAVAAARAAAGTAPPPPAPPRAVTRYRVLASNDDAGFALVALAPVTGRKHQLRKVAAGTFGAPVVGDARYGAVRAPSTRKLDAVCGRPEGALLLHCASLSVRREGQGGATARAPLPLYFRAALARLGWGALGRAWSSRRKGEVRGGW